jgi:hypothetical protein
LAPHPNPLNRIFAYLVLESNQKAMREVTLRIPDDKYDFFMELFEQLGLEKSDDFEIPEPHKEIEGRELENRKKIRTSF